MRYQVAVVAIALSAGCAGRVPRPASVAPGVPYVSWVIMSGDRDNPDQDFVCQSEPRNDCVVMAGCPEMQVFSDAHFYFHGTSGETTYTGSIQIGFFDGPAESNVLRPNITVKKGESIVNSSITDRVTPTAGAYKLTFAVDAASKDGGQSRQIRESVDVAVKCAG